MLEIVSSRLSSMLVKLLDESGQDSVEYGLAFAVLALGCTATLHVVADDVGQAVLVVYSLLTSAIT